MAKYILSYVIALVAVCTAHEMGLVSETVAFLVSVVTPAAITGFGLLEQEQAVNRLWNPDSCGICNGIYVDDDHPGQCRCRHRERHAEVSPSTGVKHV